MLCKKTLTLKKAVPLILGALGMGALISCSGRPVTENPLGGKNYMLEGYIYGDMDNDGETEVIPNIEVSTNYGISRTNQFGKFGIIGYTEPENFTYEKEPGTDEYDYSKKKIFIKLEIRDVDGESNGKFKSSSKKCIVNSYYEDYSNIEITLERDE